MQQGGRQQAYGQQLQLQRSMMQQQYAFQQAQKREANRQQRFANANARREKKAKAELATKQKTSAGQQLKGFSSSSAK